MGKHSKRVSLSMLLLDSVDSSACSDGNFLETFIPPNIFDAFKYMVPNIISLR